MPRPDMPRLAAQTGSSADERAETEADEPFGYRKFAFAALGAVIGAVPAYFTDEPDNPRTCQSRECLMVLGGGIGAAVGFLIGRDLDAEAAERFAVGPALRFRSRAIELGLMPAGFSVYNGGALVFGREALSVVNRGERSHLAAQGLRGITAAAALPGKDVIIAGTATGLYAFPLLRSTLAEGNRIAADTDITTIKQVEFTDLLMGGGGTLRRAQVTGAFGNLDIDDQVSARVSERLGDLAVSGYSGVVWGLAGDLLVARTAASLEPLSRVRLPVAGTSVALSRGRAVIAAGADGLFLVDIEDPEAPRLIGRIGGMPFAFDAAMRGDTVYVAAGQSGLLVVDAADPANPQTIGVARNIGFASAVELAPEGGVYVLDKRGRRLLVLEPEFDTAG